MVLVFKHMLVVVILLVDIVIIIVIVVVVAAKAIIVGVAARSSSGGIGGIAAVDDVVELIIIIIRPLAATSSAAEIALELDRIVRLAVEVEAGRDGIGRNVRKEAHEEQIQLAEGQEDQDQLAHRAVERPQARDDVVYDRAVRDVPDPQVLRIIERRKAKKL